MNWLRSSHLARFLPLLLLTATVGCGGGRYPVTGQVTYEDGSPLEAGTVIAEATIDGEPVSIQGNIERDGSFSMGADVPGDGALPGSYRAIVMPVSLGDSELAAGKQPAVHSKYGNYDTSGFTFEVKPEKNVLNLTVTRPKGK
jgi:hypothetical protein